MGNYLILGLAVVLMALDNAIRKRFQLSAGTSLPSGLYFNVILGGSAALLFWCVNRFRLEWTPFSLLLAFLQAGLAVGYTVIGFRIMKESVSTYALFLMTGSMVIPWLWGVFFLKERPSALQICGLILIFAAVLLSQGGGLRLRGSLLPLCFCVFILNGLAGILTKLHQIESVYATVGRMDFLILVNLAKLVISGAALMLPALRKGLSSDILSPKKMLPVLLCTAVSGAAFFLQLTAAGKVHATVMYPMITGGGILCSMLCAWLFFGEKPSMRIRIGTALCLAGTCLFL